MIDSSDITYCEHDTYVVCDKYLYRFMKMLCSKSVQINRMVLVAFDSLSISTYLEFDYNYLWICSSNTRYIVRNKEMFNNKGYFKDILVDFVSNVPTDIMPFFYINNTEHNHETITEHIAQHCGLIQSKADDEGIDFNNNRSDLINKITFVNPKIVETNQQAYKMLLNKEYSRIGDISDHVYELRCTRPVDIEDRVNALVKKQTKIEEGISTVVSRLRNTLTCNICFEELTNDTFVRCCRNKFCFTCINTWLTYNNKCPICKVDMSTPSKNQIVILETWYRQMHSTEMMDSNTKLQNLFALLNTIVNDNSKVLLCYGNNHQIKPILKYHKYAYSSINKSHRKSQIILINKGSSVQGMEINNVSDVVFFDDNFYEYSTLVIRAIKNESYAMWRII